MRRRLGVAVAGQVAALVVAAASEPSSYTELVQQYAAGERTVAVQGLAAFSDGQLAKQLESLRGLLQNGARCPSCPLPLGPVTLRAAVMLHTDRDELDRRPLQLSGERSPTCGTPVQAALAERALLSLLDDTEGREFARRWYLAMALRSLGDLCFDEGRQWAGAGLKRFPKDKELLVARGELAEALAVVALLRQPNPAGLAARERDLLREQQVETHALLTEAGAAYEKALASDPAFEEASLHLGRVRYRLDQPAAALSALDALIAASHDPTRLYLAHLFAGRTHEGARRSSQAEREYREAIALEPSAQAAPMALSHLRLMAGDSEAARAILEAALGSEAPRARDDPFWDYQFGPSRRTESIFEALRNEATER